MVAKKIPRHGDGCSHSPITVIGCSHSPVTVMGGVVWGGAYRQRRLIVVI